MHSLTIAKARLVSDAISLCEQRRAARAARVSVATTSGVLEACVCACVCALWFCIGARARARCGGLEEERVVRAFDDDDKDNEDAMKRVFRTSLTCVISLCVSCCVLRVVKLASRVSE